ncbi:SdrD B-like domain-containing protein [Spirosoma sp. SC4-14]|uniref:SdrD B-like domain-containing protein n=1 Tax=Spirosoma sp. SC4-14 TaxID=3128900 RepID=UPI0030CD22A6
MTHLYLTFTNRFRNGLLAVIVFSMCVSAAQAQIQGTIFRDFDLNGIRSDTLPIEVGIAGVLVRAFVETSKTPIITLTDNAGAFSFSDVDIPAGKQVRIEFENLPSGYYNGPYGANSRTSVQFVRTPASRVNLGINYPSDYCQPTGVRLAVPCYINGNSQTTTDANGNPVPADKQSGLGDALVGLAYEANGMAGASNFAPDHLATAGQVGAIWALAYQRRTKKLFSAAVVKRHMSFGPLGTGGIYVTDMATGATSNFIDLKTIGIDTGDDPHSDLFGDKTQASTDAGTMGAMGRLSIGGMDMSEDDKTLYLINLKDRKLYGVFLNTPAHVPTAADVKSWAIPDPGCSNGDFRPWAVKVHHGKVYVGVVCSAETSQQQSDLKATIYRFDPTSNSPVFETVLSFPLDFRRGIADATYDPAFPDQACTKYDHWLPWTDAWPAPCGQGVAPYFVMYPQPIVSDLEFDDDGSMIIGFLDRFGHLAGVANHDPQGNGFYDGFTGGDLLRAFNDNGTYVLESNGHSGTRTGSGVGNNEGPGGGEFYGKDNWFFIDHYGHSEVTNGALALVPGYNEILTSAFDPIENIFQSGGLKVFNNHTGQSARNFVLYTNSPGSFGKASGLGDVKALCDPAPVEIGNRVWYDDNRDGIQDAYEPGIDGLVLTLHDMEANGTQIATQTTHNGGQYYFNNATVPGGLQFGHTYEVRMDTAQLAQLNLSAPNAQPAASGGRLAARAAGARKAAPSRFYFLSPANRSDFQDGDLRDSDAQMNGTYAFMSVKTMDAGQNDFTYDLSVYSCPALTTERDTIRLCAGATVDSVAAQGYYLSRADSVRFVLFSSPQSGTAMYENSGVVLGTVKPDASNRAVLYSPLINTTGNASVQNQYVYAIIYPTPENPACRQSGYTVLEVKPSVAATATGGTLTCATTTITLTGKAQNPDGTEATGASYAWHGPNSFSSTGQNPVVNQPGTYTLTVTDPACQASLISTTAQVLADTAKPALMATGGTLPCTGCTIKLHADAPGATLTWTGPNGFSSSETDPEAKDPGEYTVMATGTNGCLTVVRVVVWPYLDPCLNARPVCLPVLIVRIKR